ncbi:hypothetical protein, partial [uncultured Gammaproteobacteria bacterium]
LQTLPYFWLLGREQNYSTRNRRAFKV